MRIRTVRHEDYQVLEKTEIRQLYNVAKKNLRVGFEIEMNYPDIEEEDNARKVLELIQKEFEEKHGFTMSIGKGTMSKKKIKKIYFGRYSNEKLELPVEVEVDGYKEHFLVPYGYEDDSVFIELVASPLTPDIKVIEQSLKTINDIVTKIDMYLIPDCLRNCGLHQTVVFEHLVVKFPQAVVANVIQIVRAFMGGLFYLLSAGNNEKPTRSLAYRNFNPSVWRSGLVSTRHALVFPKGTVNEEIEKTEYWGIEFRYPDGTLSHVLAAAQAVVNTAIVLKAIKLSEYGVVEISNEHYRKNREAILDFQTNNQERESSKRSQFQAYLKSNALDLMKFIGVEILDLDEKAYKVLEKLHEKPLWQRTGVEDYGDREFYKNVDKELLEEKADVDELVKRLEKIMILETAGSKEMRNTKRRLARRLGVRFSELTKLLETNGYVWSERLKRFVMNE